MDGIGTGSSGRFDDSPDIEEVDGKWSFRRRLDDLDADALGCPTDPARDLASVGDEEKTDPWPGRLGRDERVRRDTPSTPNSPRR